ncbi:MAG: hypothetical protein IJP82_07100 [Bacteroidaceae bacterium]|nr:hypothetical protein [Bacteroidaceae bacterium]
MTELSSLLSLPYPLSNHFLILSLVTSLSSPLSLPYPLSSHFLILCRGEGRGGREHRAVKGTEMGKRYGKMWMEGG